MRYTLKQIIHCQLMNSLGTEHEIEKDFFERNPWVPYICVIFAVVFASSSFIVGRYLREDILPMGLVFWRSLIVIFVVSVLFYPHVRSQLPLVLRHWKLMLALGLTYAVVGTGAMFYGLRTTTALNAGFIASTQPAIMIIMAWIALSDTISVRQIAGLILAFVGVLIIICRGDANSILELRFVVGDFWIQMSIVGWSVYGILVKKYAPKEMNPFVLLWGATIAASILTIPLYVAELGVGGVMIFDWLNVAAIIFAASLVGSLVTWNIGLTYIGPGMTSMFVNLSPVVTALMAIGLLGEVFKSFHAIGMICVLVGILLTVIRSVKSLEKGVINRN